VYIGETVTKRWNLTVTFEDQLLTPSPRDSSHAMVVLNLCFIP
jgi:hypothetical protein